MDALVRLADDLRAALGSDAVAQDAGMSGYTTLRVGGPAELLAVVSSAVTLKRAATLAWKSGIPYRVLGSGSNILVSDAGMHGLVILNRASAITFDGEKVSAESGAILAKVARQCIARGLAGLEWAVGIPGSVGGAVVGNAGAWGSDVASTLDGLKVFCPVDSPSTSTEPAEPGTKRSGRLGEPPQGCDWTVSQMQFGYRTSVLKQQGGCTEGQTVVLEARFRLSRNQRTTLQARAAEFSARRKASQPSGASCGSVFKNPPGDHAGRLIEAAGLKGQRRGGAQISPKHANFIVNRGGATATDVKALIDCAVDAVAAQFGVTLETEIQLLGDWQSEA